jgi:flagellar hook-length control protein FliK
MADLLSLSTSGKGLFTLTNADPLALQSGQLFAGETAELPSAGSAHAGDAGEQSAAFATFASLFDSQLDLQQPGRTSVLSALSSEQQASPSLFYAGEPLTATPLGTFQLSITDGANLPDAGTGSPAGGKALPLMDSRSGLPIAGAAQPAGTLAGADLEPAPGVVASTEGFEHSAQAPALERTGPLTGMPRPESAITAAQVPQHAHADAADDIFDDLAFLPEQNTGGAEAVGDTGTSNAVAAASTLVASQPQPGAASAQAGAAAVDSTAELAAAEADELLASKSIQASVEESDWRQHNRLAGEGAAGDASRRREAPAGTTERVGTASSRQQFADQLAQSTLADTDTVSRTSTAREQLSQPANPAPAAATAQTPQQATPDIQHATRSDPAATALDQARPGTADNKSVDIRLAVPFTRKDWSEQLGKQLGFLVSRNLDSAQIQLDPPELGPLQVRIQMQQDQVSLQFHAQHGIVREAVDQSLGRLQELFGEEGLELVSVDVSDGESNGESADEGQQPGNRLASEPGAESDEILTPVVSQLNSDGKIDYFI